MHSLPFYYSWSSPKHGMVDPPIRLYDGIDLIAAVILFWVAVMMIRYCSTLRLLWLQPSSATMIMSLLLPIVGGWGLQRRTYFVQHSGIVTMWSMRGTYQREGFVFDLVWHTRKKMRGRCGIDDRSDGGGVLLLLHCHTLIEWTTRICGKLSFRIFWEVTVALLSWFVAKFVVYYHINQLIYVF